MPSNPPRNSRQRRPLIGVTGPDEGGDVAWWMTAWGIWQAGGRPIRMTPNSPGDARALQGLVIGGGADVAPALYGEELLEDEERNNPPSDFMTRGFNRVIGWSRRIMSDHSLVRHDASRDAFERPLIEQALSREIPLLCICRGAQLLNVHLGGKLHQSLNRHYKQGGKFWTILPQKPVMIQEHSLVAKTLGTISTKVNSLHYQAVSTLGQGVEQVAVDAWGVTQAIEMPSKAFVLGVQWHPEYMPHVTEQRQLFAALVSQAKGC